VTVRAEQARLPADEAPVASGPTAAAPPSGATGSQEPEGPLAPEREARAPAARPDDDARTPAAAAPLEQPAGETGGPKGPEPTRYGDWEKGGRCFDF